MTQVRFLRRRAFFPTIAKRAVQAISLTLENAVNRGLLQSLRSFAMTFSDNVKALKAGEKTGQIPCSQVKYCSL
jgi:hypothetical protein